MKIWLQRIYYLLFGLGVQLYFKRIYLRGLNNMPEKGPVWLNSSHSNAFLDASLLGLYAKRSLWYLARSDVFKNTFTSTLLNAHGILPIYRMEEGFQGLTNNEKTFETCYAKLAAGNAIAIYPEGNCIRESRLRPLKKGSARIAQGLFQYAGFTYDELPVIAVGLNYDLPDSFGSDLHLCLAEPMLASDFFKRMEGSASASVLNFTRQLAIQMNEAHVNLVDPGAARVFYFIKRNFASLFFSAFDSDNTDEHTSKSYFSEQKKLANHLNKQFADEENRKIKELVDAVNFLSKERIHENTFSTHAWVRLVDLVWLLPSLLFLFPFALLNLPVFLVSFTIAKRIVKLPEFFTSVNLPGGTVLGLIYYSAMAGLLYIVSESLSFVFLIIPFIISCGILFFDARKHTNRLLNDFFLLMNWRNKEFRMQVESALAALNHHLKSINP